MIALVTLVGYVVGYALAFVACCVVVEVVRALWRRRERLRGYAQAAHRLVPRWPER